MDQKTPRTRKAIRLYQKHHPEHGSEVPSTEEIFDWLLKRNGIDFVAESANKMAQIAGHIQTLGPLNPAEVYHILGEWLIVLRVMAQPPITIVMETEE
jgi:hypothetical protein